MADTARDRFSPFGIALFVVGILAILIFAFIMTQRGGNANGEVGADGINLEPEQIEVEEALEPEEQSDQADVVE